MTRANEWRLGPVRRKLWKSHPDERGRGGNDARTTEITMLMETLGSAHE
jgi:hypothetical protein